VPRRSASLWTRAAPAPTSEPRLGARAQAVRDYLLRHGASFFDEIVEATHLLRTQVEDALGELVAQGLVSSDSFSGLRALLTPSEKRKRFGSGKRGRRALFGIEDAGRWALVRRGSGSDPKPPAAASGSEPKQETLEHIAHTLLRRYGVVFWRLLQREAAWLPPWRDLLRVLRRLEARGDLRGGRFVAGVTGEQFALPEAVTLLRDTRRSEASGEFISISAADPLNVVGTLLPGARIAALTGNRILYRDGVAVAALVGGEVQWLAELDAATARSAEDLLVRRVAGSPLLAYLR